MVRDEGLSGVNPQLSLCMTVKNEAQLIERAIESVRSVVDEIVVVDTGSTDETREIAARCGARVHEHAWDGWSGARNAALRAARGRWVLVLDGDEAIAPRDAVALRQVIDDPCAVGYWLTVHNYTRSLDLLCDWHPNRGSYPDEEEFSDCPGHSRFGVLRLFRRETSVHYPNGPTSHINPLESLRALGGELRQADAVIHHFQYRKGGEEFIARKQCERLADEQRHLLQYPDDALAQLNVGRTLFALGNDAAALEHLDRAVALSDDPTRALLTRAIVRFEIGAAAGAAADAAAALERTPQSADAWIVLGMAEHAGERLTAAAAALERALALRPFHPLALNSFGVVLMDRGERENAAAYFRRALSSLPDFPAARANLADALRCGTSGDLDQTLAVQLGDERNDI
jgi:glycosyltransferase involved in cell wall biosynthesis